jgi:flagellar protein FliS
MSYDKRKVDTMVYSQNASYTHAAARQYKDMNTQSAVEYADSHQLITMLFDGAMERIAAAKGAMANKDVSSKGILISKALLIVEALRAYLDMEKGGEIAQNLKDLYDYIELRLFEANIENDESMLDETFHLINDIRSGWVQIAPTQEPQTTLPSSTEPPSTESKGFSIQG